MRFKNIKEAICVQLFEKERNVGDISDILYGKRNTRISSYITELLKDGWIEPVHKHYLFKRGEKKDRREKYYKATPKSIIDSINGDVSLNKIQRRKLESLFEKTNLIDYIVEVLKKERAKRTKMGKSTTIEDFTRIKLELGLLGIYSIIYFEDLQKKMGLRIKDFRSQSKNALKMLLKAGVTKNEVKESMKSDFLAISGRSEGQLDIDTKLQLDDLIYNFIECGKDFMNKISYLQPYNSRDLIDLAEFIMGSFETMDRIVQDPRVQKLKKELEEKKKLKS